MELKIEKACMRDLQEIREIYANARTFMAENGNPGQWTGGYPTDEILINDIELGQLYVARPASGNRNIACVFAFFVGLDPSYFSIEDGAWLNDAEYGVIHRVAVAKWARGRGAALFCLEHCFEIYGNVRIDTHENNIPMQGLIEKCGFRRCGIVHMADDGTPRIAYQKCASLILASNSPRRRELMKKLQRPFFVDPARSEEELPGDVKTEDAALYLSGKKAEEVYERYKGKGATVIGSDTVVLLDGHIYGKPRDEEDAARMLRELSGRTHEVRTGVTIITDKGREGFSSVSKVSFYELTEQDIAYYVSTGEPMDKAGAYGIQDEGALLIKGIEGDYYTVMGLPIAELNRKLNGSGIFCRM